MLPDWLPNIHPLLVHFPIALLTLAVLLDVVAAFWRKMPWLRPTVGLLYVVGAVGALATYLSGRVAADSVLPPPEATPVLTEHADLALYTVILFGILALVRVWALWRLPAFRAPVDVPLILVGLIGLGLLVETADHGGELVYRFGVGVAVATEEQAPPAPPASLPVEALDGSYVWRMGPGADRGWLEAATVLEGTLLPERLVVLEDSVEGAFLRWYLNGDTVHATIGKPLASIQVDVRFRADSLQGTFWVTHHVQDALHFQFAGWQKGKWVMGEREGDVQLKAQKAAVLSPGWHVLRVVADGTHYRMYLDGTMVLHTHGAAWEAGPVGLYLTGAGSLDLHTLSVRNLRP